MRNRLRAVIKIQRAWRNKKWQRLLPKLRFHKKHQSAIRIQKYLRGYLIFKQSFRERARERIDGLTDYFAVMRYRMLLDAQIKIAYRWRRYFRKVKRELEEEKRLQKKL
jgi:hypothetical protein